MKYNLNNPNLDFDIEQEALINALKGARADRQEEAPQPRMMGNWAMNTSPLGGIGAALTRAAGGIDENRLMGENRALSNEQRNRFDALQQQLATPAPTTRTVQALRQGEGPLMEPNIDQRQEPIPEQEYALAENQRRMGVAQQMARLPMARGMAEKLWAKGVDYPEKMRELEIKQIDKGANAATDRLLKQALLASTLTSQEKRATEGNQTRISIAGMPARDGAGPRDRLQIAYTPEGKAYVVNLDEQTERPLGAVGKAPRASTEAERTAAGYLGRMEEAEKLTGSIKGGDATELTETAGALPMVGNYARRQVSTPEQQKIRQAQEDWVRAKLRKESGAVIGKDEMDREIDMYFPKPGDKSEVKLQKQQSRAQAAEQLRVSAGDVRARVAPPVGVAPKPYDAEKEARYQAWLKGQSK